MAKIQIDPDQVESVSGQFSTKRGELDALIGQSNNLMKGLQGAWTGSRATKTFSEWESLRPNLQAAEETLQRASELLKAAAADFRSADTM